MAILLNLVKTDTVLPRLLGCCDNVVDSSLLLSRPAVVVHHGRWYRQSVTHSGKQPSHRRYVAVGALHRRYVVGALHSGYVADARHRRYVADARHRCYTADARHPRYVADAPTPPPLRRRRTPPPIRRRRTPPPLRRRHHLPLRHATFSHRAIDVFECNAKPP